MQGNPSDSWGFMVDFHSQRLSRPSVFLAKFSGETSCLKIVENVYLSCFSFLLSGGSS